MQIDVLHDLICDLKKLRARGVSSNDYYSPILIQMKRRNDYGKFSKDYCN